MKLMIFLLAILAAPIAHADCTDPAGVESDIVYNSTYKIPQYCNGTDWVAWGSGYSEKWGSTGNNVHYTAGNVGIGTSSPTEKLSIYDAGLSSLRVEGGSLSGQGAGIQLVRSGSNAMCLTNTDGAVNINHCSGSYPGDSVLYARYDGNVGIGTTSPDRELDISGDLILQDDIHPTIYYKESDNSDLEWSTVADGRTWSLRLNNTSPYPINVQEDKEVIFDAGNVGIGTTTPSYKLHVNGTAYATGAAGSLSDRRHKKEIVGLPDNGLATVAALRPVSFLWKEPKDKPMEGTQLGFIAQEVEEVLPEAVLTQDNDEHTKGLKYNVFMPVVVKAMQEQQSQIQELKAENDALKSFVCEEKPAHAFCQ